MGKLLMEYGPIYDGRMTAGKTGKTLADINPATGEVLAEISCAGKEDVDLAVESSRKAFREWKKTSRAYRAELLNRMADAIECEKEHLAEVECRDTGKCYGEALMHIGACVGQYRYFAGVVSAYEDVCVTHDSNCISMIVREPFGVVAVILPWNAPSMLMAWKLAPALAAGNTVVMKPASSAPLPVLEMARLFQDILPPGVLNVLPGTGKETGNYLANHPGISKLSFTGSTEIGCLMGEIAGKNVIPCTLELGGKSANIVFPDATIDRAVDTAAAAILSSSGQICVAGSRLFLHEDIYDDFIEKLKAKFESFKVGDPMQPDVQMGPVIDQVQMNRILEYIEIGKKEGARLVCGGKRLTGGIYDKGFFIAPTLFVDVNNKMRIAQEEIFGPVLSVLKFKNEEEAVEMANDSIYGLGAAVWTNDLNRAIRVSRLLEAGTVWVNNYLPSPPGSPFGGYKKSGIGREVHKSALDYYTQIKNISITLD
jgi:aldehyde dehydrogenase (NAD+)